MLAWLLSAILGFYGAYFLYIAAMDGPRPDRGVLASVGGVLLAWAWGM